MTGNSFGDVTPQNTQEEFISVLIMVLGASVFAKVFSDFEYIISMLGREKQQHRYHLLLT